jgi:hypothetical protein
MLVVLIWFSTEDGMVESRDRMREKRQVAQLYPNGCGSYEESYCIVKG